MHGFRIVRVPEHRRPDIGHEALLRGDIIEALEERQRLLVGLAEHQLRQRLGDNAYGLDFVAALFELGFRLSENLQRLAHLRIEGIAQAHERRDRPDARPRRWRFLGETRARKEQRNQADRQ